MLGLLLLSQSNIISQKSRIGKLTKHKKISKKHIRGSGFLKKAKLENACTKPDINNWEFKYTKQGKTLSSVVFAVLVLLA